MFRNRRKNWLIKRVALGFAVAAFVAPAAQAKIDEGAQVQQNAPALRPIPAESFTQPSKGSDVQLPRTLPSDYVQLRDKFEFIRPVPSWTSSTSPELVGRFSKPDVIRGPEAAATPNVDFEDAATGAGLILVLVLLGAGAALATRQVGREQTA